ncbi:hypothetical protein IMCC20628_03583 [Hoeflea sp. IMCC20628]|uniref:hypothetical protein n=1 Tax=Hoeflea sp. IMCC20628 TaxID=1620421 RepID=UPI00063AA39A|nr:hypothetical protein [Hoeflea sp. IMCC20628]AKI02269.1 hypothetical protein IMCC20628_03583 [Hoeflea sp. IMCC20628]
METQTIQKISAITDVGLFERIATAVLRLVPDYEGLVHTGINADGKTRKSPVDGLRFTGEGGNRLIMVHHTITATTALERKWLLDPVKVKHRKTSKSASPEPGDVIKAFAIIRKERAVTPNLSATLILTTNQEPDEELLRKVTAIGRQEKVTIDFWTRSRIAARLDIDPRGQVIRNKLLGMKEELLSRELFAKLSEECISAFDAGDNTSARVSRTLDAQLGLGLGPINFLVGPSGSGKTVAAHKALLRQLANGGGALVIAHTKIEQALTLQQAVTETLLQLQPSLAPSQNPLTLFSEEDPLFILIEDVSRSAQPQRLIEKIAGWAPDTKSTNRPPWRIICPVWPHLLSAVRSQTKDRVEMMSLRPEPMSHAECVTAVLTKASTESIALNREEAEAMATALGDDALLIALNRDWHSPRANQVIDSFANDALARVAQISGQIASELRSALLDLGKSMLHKRCLAPTWSDVLEWDIDPEVVNHVRAIAREGEVFRIDGVSSDARLLFRHDRVRVWLLAEVAFKLWEKGQLDNELLADPSFAEIIGEALVRAAVPEELTTRIQTHGPLALFHALRLLPTGDPGATRLAEIASKWLRNPKNRGASMATLRWQAMAMIERVSGEFMQELISLFPQQSPMGMIALLRNGDVRGGIDLAARYDLTNVAHWTAQTLDSVRPLWGSRMATELSSLMDATNVQTDEQVDAIIEFSGALGDPDLALALKRLWVRDEERGVRLGSYLWAMARCSTPETAAQLLAPVCALWGALPESREGNGPSPRDELAAYSVRFAFERMPPVGALSYLIDRAKKPDLGWQIEYMLHGVDHSSAVFFQVKLGADRLRDSGHIYSYKNHAREFWRRTQEGFGSPMSPSIRESLLVLWNDTEENEERRKAAFDLWAACRYEADLSVLQASARDAFLYNSVLRERLSRGDTKAVPALIEQLDGEDGLHWWFYARYVWSAEMYKVLDRAFAREAAKSLPDENRMYDIGSTLTRVLMRLTAPDAENLLLSYWGNFGHTMHFVQAALFVATPELLSLADSAIRSDPDPAKLFTHFTMHFGIRTKGEVGLSRESQLNAIALYIELLRPEDIEQLADVCNDNGWYSLRRKLLDPHRETARIETPERFRHILDETLMRGHTGFIDHDIDNFQKADVPWHLLAPTLEQWLSDQPSIRALELAVRAIRHAGQRADIAILEQWPGDQKATLLGTTADLDFELRLHSR